MRKIIIICFSMLLISCNEGVDEDNSFYVAEDVNTLSSSINDENNDSIEDVEEFIIEDSVVIIKDKVLENILREKLNKPSGDLLQSDMNEIENININYEETPVYELDGLEYAVNLRMFAFRNGQLKSLNPITSNQYIYKLGISYASVEETVDLLDMPMLENISLVDVRLPNYDFMRTSEGIVSIYISNGQISSLDIVENMHSINEINIIDSGVSSIDALKNKTQLQTLILQGNEITDISVLNTCSALSQLNLSYNNVTNIEPILDLENLISFTVYEEIDKRLVDRTDLQTLMDKGVSVMYHE